MEQRVAALLLLSGLIIAPSYADETFKMKRTAAGAPDLTGTYDSATLTPLNRPESFGDKQYMTREEAQARIKGTAAALYQPDTNDPDREAPPAGGDGDSGGGKGGTGGYPNYYLDIGTDLSEVDGKFRSSIVYDPPNGRQPAMTPASQAKMAHLFGAFIHNNTGTASWLDEEGEGPFDNPESLGMAERCILGFSAGPPSLPGAYNNFKRIVQTDDYVMILMEMVHDARIIRLESEHAPPELRRWLGDSIGHWEADTLVVDTTNFRNLTGLNGGDENLHLVERFSLLDNGNLLYDFTVTDPTAWTAPWSGSYVWKRSSDLLYEYACHEHNYSMDNTLKGARYLEQQMLEERQKAQEGE
jgi:hypothetical protein